MARCPRSNETRVPALAYAKQTEQDHDKLDQARRSGRIRVATTSVVK